MKTVNFEGKRYKFPDDATDAEINGFLSSSGATPAPATQAKPQQAAAPAAPAPARTGSGLFVKSQLKRGAPLTDEEKTFVRDALPGDKGYNERMDALMAKYGSEEAIDPVGVALATGSVAAAPVLGAAMRAPIIPITAMGRNMAQGTVPTAIEPGLAAILRAAGSGAQAAGSAAKSGAQAVGRGAKTVAEDPRTQAFAKWLGKIITAAVAGGAAGRAASGRYGH